MKAEYRRVDQRQLVDILDLQSRLREEFKALTKDFKKRTATKTVTLAAAYAYENDREHRDHHATSDCGDTALLDLVRAMRKELSAAAHLAELVIAEMQNAYDDEDDEAFAELCDHYGKAEVHKGPTANTFASHDDRRSDGHSLRAQYSGLREISAVKFTVDPTLAARSVNFEDSKPADDPPRVPPRDPPRVPFTAEKTARIIPNVRTTPTVVHADEPSFESGGGVLSAIAS
ncbi:hypothetical protein CYMTET_30533 [Cymbomonas tetramitiformis]|uniref:Uncharacterized protein n=1 Tax=Cymbomonas tetramitiformis TaxID=36881 RepID=A0AAE0FK65_9CHLO|nr:hypothetical protein CYMTET_30533 [Cymbomonas tetramitiformis]